MLLRENFIEVKEDVVVESDIKEDDNNDPA